MRTLPPLSLPSACYSFSGYVHLLIDYQPFHSSPALDFILSILALNPFTLSTQPRPSSSFLFVSLQEDCYHRFIFTLSLLFKKHGPISHLCQPQIAFQSKSLDSFVELIANFLRPIALVRAEIEKRGCIDWSDMSKIRDVWFLAQVDYSSCFSLRSGRGGWGLHAHSPFTYLFGCRIIFLEVLTEW